jgi:sulfur-carrier protein
MPVLRIPTPLRAYTNGQSEVTVYGSNISDALTDLTTQYPALRPHLFNDGGELRPFVNLFVGENNIKDLQGVDTPITDGEKIMLIPSIAGGMSVRGERFSRRSNLLLRGGRYVTS